MTATKCTNVLEQEHQTIHKPVAAMSVADDRFDAGQAIDPFVHEKGRALLTQLDDATQVFVTTRADKTGLISALRDLVRLCVDHTWKEITCCCRWRIRFFRMKIRLD